MLVSILFNKLIYTRIILHTINPLFNKIRRIYKMAKKNDSTASKTGQITPARTLLFSPNAADLDRLLNSMTLMPGQYDTFTDVDEAMSALDKRKYTAIITDSTHHHPEVSKLVKYANIKSECLLYICPSERPFSEIEAMVWKLNRNHMFYPSHNERDMMTRSLNAICMGANELRWVDTVKHLFTAMRAKLHDAPLKMVLLIGASGTAKYSLAQIAHDRSSRKHHNLIYVNCKAEEKPTVNWNKSTKMKFRNIVERLMNQANGGTLYFHEVDNLDVEAQEIIGELISRGKVVLDGESKYTPLTGCIICSTRHNLEELDSKRHCSKQLILAMKSNVIRIPSLHEFEDEIPVIASEMLQFLCYIDSKPGKTFTAEALEKFKGQSWSRNMRELFEMVSHAYHMTRGKKVKPEAISLSDHIDKEDSFEEKRRKIKRVMHHSKTMKEAADKLGISRKTLYAWAKKYGIPLKEKESAAE